MEQSTLIIADHEYSIGAMDAMKQFHVVRRLAPLLTLLMPIILDVMASAPASKETSEDAAQPQSVTDMVADMRSGPASGLLAVKMDNLTALASALGELSDESMEYIIGACLAVVSRKQAGGTGWARVWNVSAKVPMFADMQLPTMLRLVAAVVWGNLSGFINAANALGLAGAANPPKV